MPTTVATTLVLFNSFKKALIDADVDLTADTIKFALLTAVPDVDGDDNFDDVSADETSGTNYTAGGWTLAGKGSTQDNTNDRGVFTANTITQAACSFSYRAGVLYKSTGVSSTSKLIGYIDYGSTQTLSAETFEQQWDSETGVLAIG